MKFLVTGGAGFIGGNYVLTMVEKYPEDEFVVLDALTYAGNLETLSSIFVIEHLLMNFSKKKNSMSLLILLQNHMLIAPLKNQTYFYQQMSWAFRYCLMRVKNIMFLASIKCQRMKSMVIYHLIVLIYFLRRTHLFIHLLHILLRKRLQIY